MSQRLRFGIFLAPFHKPGINPTFALQSDLELIQWLDRCGYDEAWLGEHHSAGTELSASPEIMIATAAERYPAYQAGHRRGQRVLSQSIMGGRTHRAVRSPDARTGNAWPRPRLAAHRWHHDRTAAEPDARAA